MMGKPILSHHEQQALCHTRLPYRQGRNLTAVKVYTINNESNHLLIFGVPSINLQQETKALFSKFGKLIQFHIITEYDTEAFTEIYHAAFEKIQSARIAKRILDTKDFYGGVLHICYAPERETVTEVRQKLLQRKKDVLLRLRNLKIEPALEPISKTEVSITNVTKDDIKLNMGEKNLIKIETQSNYLKNKKKKGTFVIQKRFKPCYEENSNKDLQKCEEIKVSKQNAIQNGNVYKHKNIEIVDCTSTEHKTISNINDCLNYNKFGNETILKISEKPLNRIQFRVGTHEQNKLNS